MKKQYKKLFMSTIIATGAITILPQLLLAPFAIITGFMTKEEFSKLRSNPFVLALILLNIIIIVTISYVLISKTEKIEKPKYVDLRKIGHKMIFLFYSFVLIELLQTYIKISLITPISIEHRGIYSILFSGAFIMLTCFPLTSFVVTSIEGIVINELPNEENIFLGLGGKIITLTGGVLFSTILIFVTLEFVISSATTIGRVLPFGPLVPFIIAGIMCFIAMIFILTIILGFLTKPVSNMSSAFEAASLGDFSRYVPVKTIDEVGRISALTNKLTASLSKSFNSFNISVNGIENAKNSLSHGVEEISSAITEISQNLDSTNNQMEDHSSNISQTTASIEELTKNIESLGGNISTQTTLVNNSFLALDNLLSANIQLENLADTGLQRTGTLVGVSENGRNKISNMALMINDIIESSQHLSEANGLIASVSNKTNLLAMNATIEAAHAGDAGRGFTVVADEIRNLAETSSNQSKKINANLKHLLSQIQNVGRESQEVQQAFNLITSHVAEVQVAVESINEFTTTIKGVSEDIKRALQTMGDVSQNISTGSTEMQQGNIEMLQAVTNMRDINQKVVESVSEITIGSKEIRDMSVQMLDQNRLTDEAIIDLRELLSKYTLKNI